MSQGDHQAISETLQVILKEDQLPEKSHKQKRRQKRHRQKLQITQLAQQQAWDDIEDLIHEDR